LKEVDLKKAQVNGKSRNKQDQLLPKGYPKEVRRTGKADEQTSAKDGQELPKTRGVRSVDLLRVILPRELDTGNIRGSACQRQRSPAAVWLITSINIVHYMRDD
jgi:hypothetical protein